MIAFSCSDSDDGDDTGDGILSGLTLTSDRSYFSADGVDAVVFTVKDNTGKDVSTQCVYKANDQELVAVSYTHLDVYKRQVAVTDAEGGLLGIITDGDLRRMLEKYEDVDGLKARDIMSVSPKTIQEEELAYNAFQKMEQNSITQLVVVDEDKKYKGMVHIHDILREGVV